MSKNKIRIDIVVNIIFSIIKAFCLMYVIRIASNTFTQAALGSFLLARRNSNTGANLLQMGMSQTIKRNIAKNAEDKNSSQFVVYALHGWVAIAVVTIPIVLLSLDFLRNIIYPNTNFGGELVLWTWILLIAFILDFIVVSTFMARRMVISANIVEFVNVAGFIILVFLFNKGLNLEPYEVIMWQSCGIIIFSCIFIMLYLYRQKVSIKIDISQRDSILKEFIKYGLPRGFITFFDMLLLLIMPWLLREDPEQAGYLLIAFTVVKIIQTVINPVSQIVSVTVARFAGENKDHLIEKGIRLMVGATLYSSILIVACLLPWMELLTTDWLKNTEVSSGVLNYIIILLIATIPLSVFQGLKSTIEMIWYKPYNLYSLMAGIGVQYLSFIIIRDKIGNIIAANISILLSFVIIGAMSIYWIRQYIRTMKYFGFNKLILMASILGTMNYAGAQIINNSFIAIAYIGITGGVVAAVMLIFLKIPFCGELIEFIMPQFLIDRRSKND